jgi:hypothetical protein
LLSIIQENHHLISTSAAFPASVVREGSIPRFGKSSVLSWSERSAVTEQGKTTALATSVSIDGNVTLSASKPLDLSELSLPSLLFTETDLPPSNHYNAMAISVSSSVDSTVILILKIYETVSTSYFLPHFCWDFLFFFFAAVFRIPCFFGD